MSRVPTFLFKTSQVAAGLPVPAIAASVNLAALSSTVVGMELAGYQVASFFDPGPQLDQALEQTRDIYRVIAANAKQVTAYPDVIYQYEQASMVYQLPNQVLSEFQLNLLTTATAVKSVSMSFESSDANASSEDKLISLESNFAGLVLQDSPQNRNLDTRVELSNQEASRSQLDNVVSGSMASGAVSTQGDLYYSNGHGDFVRGSSLNDTLVGANAGGDTLSGILGDDAYIVRSADTFILDPENSGFDTLLVSVENYVTDAEIEKFVVLNSSGNYMMHTLVPDVYSHTIDVGWHLLGNAYNQILIGGNQADVLNGLGGADTLLGGLGDDVYYFSGNQTIIENLNQGIDIVRTGSSLTLADNVEIAVAESSAGDVALSGNATDNLLIGNVNANKLSGASGDDTLIGNGGDDIYIGGAGHDLFVLNSSDSFVGEIADFQSGVDQIEFSLDAGLHINSLTLVDAQFTGLAGEVLYASGMLQMDWDGDASADTFILLNSPVVASDLLLIDPYHLPGI